nr:MAG TPA: hypothetical protein [Caudoviricetes sp.]
MPWGNYVLFLNIKQMQCKCDFLHNKGLFLVKILYKNCK